MKNVGMKALGVNDLGPASSISDTEDGNSRLNIKRIEIEHVPKLGTIHGSAVVGWR